MKDMAQIVKMISYLIMVCAIIIAANSNASTLEVGLIGRYSSGNPFQDLSSSSNNLTVVTSGISLSTNQKGENQSAIYFQNNADFVKSSKNVGISGNTPFSYSLWIKFNTSIDLANRHVLSFGQNFNQPFGGASSFVVNNSRGNPSNWLSSDGLNGAIANAGGWADVGVGNIGLNWEEWHHFAFVYDGSLATSKFYYDSQYLPNMWIGGGNQQTEYNINDTPLTLGIIPDVWDGIAGASLSDIRLYNKALSGAEVSEIYFLEVPEPSALSLLAFGLGGLALLRQGRKKD